MTRRCDVCGGPLIPRQRRWCSPACRSDGAGIGAGTLAHAKQLFPACAQDWDAQMVDGAKRSMMLRLARKLTRLDARRDSA